MSSCRVGCRAVRRSKRHAGHHLGLGLGVIALPAALASGPGWHGSWLQANATVRRLPAAHTVYTHLQQRDLVVAQPPGDVAEALKVAEDLAHLLHPALQALAGALRRRADADLVEGVPLRVEHLALAGAVKGVHLGSSIGAGAHTAVGAALEARSISPGGETAECRGCSQVRVPPGHAACSRGIWTS
jgi:hypothetical protein